MLQHELHSSQIQCFLADFDSAQAESECLQAELAQLPTELAPPPAVCQSVRAEPECQ